MTTEPFVPLSTSPPAAAGQDFRVLVVPAGAPAEPFRSPASAGPAASATAAASRPPCEPRVSLLREDERVTGIHIQCSCGQIIDLACVYQHEPPAA